MVIFQAINAIFSLDINFFINIFMNNLLWVFVFYALIHYFMEGRRVIYFFLVFSFLLWSFVDFEILTGLAWNAAGFLLIYYLTKIALLTLAEDIPSLKNKLLWISEVQFVFLLFAYIFFLK